MDAHIWKTISIVGYSLAGVLSATAIFLFFKLKILAIIGDLTGKTAAKQIQEIREQNKLTGSKHYRPNAFNLERGVLTEPVDSRQAGSIGKTGQALAHRSKRLGVSGETGRRSKWLGGTDQGAARQSRRLDAAPREPNFGGETAETSRPIVFIAVGTQGGIQAAPSAETTVLVNDHGTEEQDNGTEVLPDGGTAFHDENETEVLVDGTAILESGTEVLMDGTAVLYSGTGGWEDGTAVLTNGIEGTLDGTEYLAAETEVLDQGTDVLDSGTEGFMPAAETTVLTPTVELENEEQPEAQPIDFKVIKDLKIIHSSTEI